MTAISVAVRARGRVRDRLRVVRLSAWVAPSVHISRRWNAISSPPPHSIFPSWDSKTRRNNLMGGPCRQSNGRSKQTLRNSPHPSSRRGTSFHRSGGARVFLLSHLVTCVPHAYLRASSGPLETRCRQPRCGCMITANRRASANDRLLHPAGAWAIFIAQALSHDHFAKNGPAMILSRFVEHHPASSRPPHFDIAPVRLISPD